MSVVDASVWVSLLAADDVNHMATQIWFDQRMSEGARFVAPTLVLVEVAGAMTRRTGDASLGLAAAARVRSFPELELVALTVDAAEQSASIAARHALRGEPMPSMRRWQTSWACHWSPGTVSSENARPP